MKLYISSNIKQNLILMSSNEILHVPHATLHCAPYEFRALCLTAQTTHYEMTGNQWPSFDTVVEVNSQMQ